MNADRFAYLVAVLILIPLLGGCGTFTTPTSLPIAQAPATVALPSPALTVSPPTLAASPAPGSKEATVTLTWFGQSTFVLVTSTGLKALLDPASPGTGYKIPTQTGIDLVTVSHEHSDHNAVDLAAGSPLILRGLAGNDWAKIDQTVKGVRVRTVGVYHDDTQGSKRGKNAIFVFEVDGLRLAHLGDLGHTLSSEQIKDVGPVDVILISVGGFYTIDGKTAAEVVNQLGPKVIIPMHYKTPDLTLSLAAVLAPADNFIKAVGNTSTVSDVGQTVTIERGKLPADRTIMVMKYK